MGTLAMIYFLRRPEGGPIKIGSTINLTKRLEGHRSVMGGDFVVLGVMPGNTKEEMLLHRQFWDLKIPKPPRLEWFEPREDLLEFIRTHSTPWDGSVDAPSIKYKDIFVYRVNSELAEATEEWLSAFCKETGMSLATLVDAALFTYAKQRGFRRKPPRGMPSRKR